MLRVAICQVNGERGKVDENLLAVECLVAERAGDADLFCFPELYREGYTCSVEEFRTLAEEADGASSLRMRACAKKHSVYIAYGYAEKAENGSIYNAGQVVSPEGNLLLNYRKTHLYDPFMVHERVIFDSGEALSDIVDINGFKCALLICWDVELPEICRVLAVRGARCFIVLTANGSDLTNNVTVRSRAIENNSFMIYANRVGSDNSFTFNGQSVAYAPNGSCISILSKTKEECIVATLDNSKEENLKFVAANPLLLDRRPELYRDLVN